MQVANSVDNNSVENNSVENNETDNEIRITIRTGTSTRRPVEREYKNNENNIIPLVSVQFFIDRDDILAETLNSIIQRSLNETELKRNGNIKLNTPCFKYEKKEPETCVICQEKISQGDTVSKISCGHVHHYNCLEEWAKYTPKCPTCRHVIPVLER